MKSPDGNNLGSVGIAFVALCGATSLGMMWRIGARVARELSDQGYGPLPADVQRLLDGRVALSGVVVVLFIAAISLQRGPRPVPILVLLGLLELGIAGAFGLALPARGPGRLSVLVIVVFALAIFLQPSSSRSRRPGPAGLLELSIVGVFGLALWLPYRPS